MSAESLYGDKHSEVGCAEPGFLCSAVSRDVRNDARSIRR